MDTLILGLLILQDLTVYEIRRFLRQGMYLMYSDSMGSIQTAVKKLMKDDYIVYDEYVESGKNKKIYSITAVGRDYFLDWLSQPIQSSTAQNRILTKLFFMGMLPIEKRAPIIQSHIDVLCEKLDVLQSTLQAAKNAQISDEQKVIASFQQETIQLSIQSIHFEMDWYTTLLNRINSGEELC